MKMKIRLLGMKMMCLPPATMMKGTHHLGEVTYSPLRGDLSLLTRVALHRPLTLYTTCLLLAPLPCGLPGSYFGPFLLAPGLSPLLRAEASPRGRLGKTSPLLRAPASLCLVCVLLAHITVAGAVQLRPQAGQTRPTRAGLLGAMGLDQETQLPSTSCTRSSRCRPVPTPARSGFGQPNVIFPEDEDLRTLLQCAIASPDSRAMYLASTLLDAAFGSCQPRAHQDTPKLIKLEECVPATPTPRGVRRALAAARKRIDPTVPLHIGGTPLGFALVDFEDLVMAPHMLQPWSEVARRTRFLRSLSLHQVLEFTLGLCPVAADNQVWCYTDGSFTASSTGQNLLGWACVFMHPKSGTVLSAYGAVPRDLEWTSPQGSAYDAECCALLVGAILSLREFPAEQVHFMSDCQSALSAARGSSGFLPGTLAEAACHAHTLRRQLANTDTHAYVAGHSANLGNDIADALSKLGARAEESLGLTLTIPELKMWFRDGGRKLSWVGAALRSACGESSLPPLNTNAVGNDCNHADLSPLQMLEPFVPPGMCSDSPTEVHRQIPSTAQACLALRLATFNALSLISSDGDDAARPTQGHRRNYTPGRAAILAKQLEAEGVHVAFVQEARGQAGSTRVGRYLRYASAALRGQWGSEIWLLTDHPYLRDTQKGALNSLCAKAIVSLHSDPRRLILRLAARSHSLLLVCLHGPNRATEPAEIESWWTLTRQLIQQYRKHDHLIVAGDMNASVGSEMSSHFGDVCPELEDGPGRQLHELAVCQQMWGPSTFAAHHQGASHTYVQKKSGKQCRPDFVLLPVSWKAGCVASWVAPAIHAAHPHQDHYAACVDVKMQLAGGQSAERYPRRVIKASIFSDPQCVSQIQEVLRSTPAVSWDISTHAHAAIITKHLQDGLIRISKAAPKSPKQHYLQEDTWELQGAVAKIRRAIHQRQHLLRTHLLVSVLLVWRSPHLTLEQVFLHNRWVRQMQSLIVLGVHQLEIFGKALRALCRRDRAA